MQIAAGSPEPLELQPASEAMTVLALVIAGTVLLAAAFSLVAVVAD